MTPRPQKRQDLDRRIRNLESLDPGVFTGNTIASFQALPGLVGFWPMSSVQRSTGNVYDLSYQGRTLTYNGNPAFSYYNGLIPYIDLDGTGDYLSLGDSTDLDILGTESVFTSAAAGLTMGGWFWTDTVAAGIVWAMGKNDDSTNISYTLYRSTNKFSFAVSSAGNSYLGTVSTGTITTGTWYFVAARYTPSTETAIFLNGTKTPNTTAIPASLYNGTAAFAIGARSGGANFFDGRAALCFLCANALGDELISSLYHQSRVLFGV